MIATGVCVAQDDSLEASDFPVLTGPYLGQDAPGRMPMVFAPGIISTDTVEFACSYSPDGKEFFFIRDRFNGRYEVNTIMVCRRTGAGWIAPEVAIFSGNYFDFEPFISPDGQRLYFGSKRPFEGHGPQIDLQQWVLEKTDVGWSQTMPLGLPFIDRFVMYPTESSNRTIYFTGQSGLFFSRYSNGHYLEPEPIIIDKKAYPAAAHPFIAPDESYLLFDAQVKGEGNPELFVIFRRPDSLWTDPIRLPDKINAIANEMCASVSPDGRYLFFSRQGDIYWLDARIIEELKPK
jgi:Tol biopolymer transport system component